LIFQPSRHGFSDLLVSFLLTNPDAPKLYTTVRPSANLSNRIATPTAHADLLTIFEELLPNPYREVAAGAYQHDVRHMDLTLTLNDASLLGEPTGTHMTLDHVDFLDDNTSFIGMYPEDFATLAFVFASDNLDKIILADMP
jgi:hypothetical protein